MPDLIDALNEALRGRYRVERELGAGGMATVYLAEDLKHDRKVAIKVLKPDLAAVLGADRFLAEIKTTAGLQHPHILPLFDSGESDGFLFYVMPYIEGETLRDRLDRERQLGVEEALRITRDVADALDYAHRQGVIHRDIKPDNILLHDGRPVVADFGIAVAISAAGGGRMTETGLSLGTPHYMSPEQASAERDLTIRSDVYSLACVLYEMLAGAPPHTGPTAQAILVRILTETPRPVNDARASVPPHVAAVLAKGLEKLPADRFHSAAEFRAALDRTDFTHRSTDQGSGGTPVRRGGDTSVVAGGADRRRSAAVPILAGATAILAGVALAGWLRPTAAPAEPEVYTLETRGWVVLGSERVSIAPDGRHLATVALPAALATRGAAPGDRHIVIRRADEMDFRSLVGPGEFAFVAFSPDGSRIAYADRGAEAIRVVPVAGGEPSTLHTRQGLRGSEVSWGEDGFIYFWADGVKRIPETGGDPEMLIADADWTYAPVPLPGGRALVVTEIRDNPEGNAVEGPNLRLFELGADSSRLLLRDAVGAQWVESGHLVYGNPEGGLQAVPFDLERLEITGPSTPVRDGVSVGWEGALASISRTGTLVYTEGRGTETFREGLSVLVERDLRTGVETPLPLEAREYQAVRYAPGGDRLVFSAGAPGDRRPDELYIYTYDLGLGRTPYRWTPQHTNRSPSWSPDGRRIAWVEEAGSRRRIMIRDVTVEEAARPAPIDGGVAVGGPEWASDSLLVYEAGPYRSRDLWMTGTVEGAESEPYLESESGLGTPILSPTGDRIAYMDSPSPEERHIVVRPFPERGEPTRISSGNGNSPRWHPDGGSIWYRENIRDGTNRLEGLLHRAFVTNEPIFRVDSIVLVDDDLGFGTHWDLHPDGTRAVFKRGGWEAQGQPERHVVVLNWFEEVEERLGGA